MGILVRATTGEHLVLEARTLIGRSSICALVLDDLAVSAQHAVLWWNGIRWQLRDLDSRNGTFLDGVRVWPGQRADVLRDAQLRFGRHDPGWTLVDAGGPASQARTVILDTTKKARRSR